MHFDSDLSCSDFGFLFSSTFAAFLAFQVDMVSATSPLSGLALAFPSILQTIRNAPITTGVTPTFLIFHILAVSYFTGLKFMPSLLLLLSSLLLLLLFLFLPICVLGKVISTVSESEIRDKFIKINSYLFSFLAWNRRKRFTLLNFQSARKNGMQLMLSDFSRENNNPLHVTQRGSFLPET